MSGINVERSIKLQGLDMTINLCNSGWCRTNPGGAHALNSQGNAIPVYCGRGFLHRQNSDCIFWTQAFAGMELEDAVCKIERENPSPC